LIVLDGPDCQSHGQIVRWNGNGSPNLATNVAMQRL
jgi:hypothetical protein